MNESTQINYPIFIQTSEGDIFMLDTPRDLYSLEMFDIEGGEYVQFWDVNGYRLKLDVRKEDKTIIYDLYLIDTQPDIEDLISCIHKFYISRKKSSKTFRYTGPPNDPVELYLQFQKHNSLFARLKRFIKDFFED